MKHIIFSTILIMLTVTIKAQEVEPQRNVINITQFSSGELNGVAKTGRGIRAAEINQPAEFIRHNLEIPLTNISSFLAFAIVWEAHNWDESNNTLWVRFKGNTINPEWQQVNIDSHADKDGSRHISELTFVDKDVDKLDIKIIFNEGSKALVKNLNLHFYNPGNIQKKTRDKGTEVNSRAVCTCPQPNFEDRADWCPTGNCPEISNPTITNVTHLIVHHSAGVNSSSDWAGVVRSIWDYHVNVNGWDDIGYNYLVDPNGILYEGRGNNVQGAHFCGNNSGTMGVCVMGDFTNTTPTNDAKNMLKELLAWKICDIDADPLESTFHASSNVVLPNISGHQDGCSTECPGASFYPQLQGIRTEVSEKINNDCDIEDLAAPTNLTAGLASSTAVALEWEDNSNNENIFVIERAIMTNNNYVVVGNADANITSYIDENLQTNTAYFYRVRATNGQAVSEYSNQVGIATVLSSTKSVGTLPIEIFPNPVKDQLSIRLPKNTWQEIEVNIFELGSSKLALSFKSTSASSTVTKDLSDLPKGFYLLQVNNGAEQGYAKLVKQ